MLTSHLIFMLPVIAYCKLAVPEHPKGEAVTAAAYPFQFFHSTFLTANVSQNVEFRVNCQFTHLYSFS